MIRRAGGCRLFGALLLTFGLSACAADRTAETATVQEPSGLEREAQRARGIVMAYCLETVFDLNSVPRYYYGQCDPGAFTHIMLATAEGELMDFLDVDKKLAPTTEWTVEVYLNGEPDIMAGYVTPKELSYQQSEDGSFWYAWAFIPKGRFCSNEPFEEDDEPTTLCDVWPNLEKVPITKATVVMRNDYNAGCDPQRVPQGCRFNYSEFDPQ